ncbi:MAG: DNA-deoxyinosine glycosylase [Gammaproteobacteria bacterium]|nr:DNA-deoxyinosine glycosylase [Gammaproteobacteria bacterium]
MLSGFEPVVQDNCRVLILGSMPGVASLQKQQYYAHPRNAFWAIISELLSIEDNKTYEQRCCLLKNSGVAVWDVLKACRRPGSLDSNIEPASESANDFERLLIENKSIRAVFFNGAAAERLYRKHVLKLVNSKHPELVYHCLPSSSPAYASMTYEEKLKHWHKIIEYI